MSSTIVVILGMHRSGTSFLTHALQRAGLYLGNDLWDNVVTDNLDGYGEAREGMEINDHLLHLSGGACFEIPPTLRSDEGTTARMVKFLAELSTQPIVGFKDPRTTLTFPLWKPLLADYRIVACLRHPLNVARSLQVRQSWPLERGLAAWAGYNERLWQNVQAEGGEVLWFNYDAPPKELAANLEYLCDQLGLRFDSSVLEVYNPYLRHHAKPEPLTDSRIRELYEKLLERADAQAPATPTLAFAPVSQHQSDPATEMPSLLHELNERYDGINLRLTHLARVQQMQNEALQQFTLLRNEIEVSCARAQDDLRQHVSLLRNEILQQLGRLRVPEEGQTGSESQEESRGQLGSRHGDLYGQVSRLYQEIGLLDVSCHEKGRRVGSLAQEVQGIRSRLNTAEHGMAVLQVGFEQLLPRVDESHRFVMRVRQSFLLRLRRGLTRRVAAFLRMVGGKFASPEQSFPTAHAEPLFVATEAALPQRKAA